MDDAAKTEEKPKLEQKTSKSKWPTGFDPKKQTAGYAVRLSKEEWAAVHSNDPASVYAFRPNAWRPLPIMGDIVMNTAQGAVSTFLTDGVKPCRHCGALVIEIIGRDDRGNAQMRCLGCAADRSKLGKDEVTED